MRGDELSRVFGAAADATRRSIMDRLLEGPASVTELSEPFEISFAAISKHLQVLEAAGLVFRHRKGRYRIAQLNASPLRSASTWIGQYERVWSHELGSIAARGAHNYPHLD